MTRFEPTKKQPVPRLDAAKARPATLARPGRPRRAGRVQGRGAAVVLGRGARCRPRRGARRRVPPPPLASWRSAPISAKPANARPATSARLSPPALDVVLGNALAANARAATSAKRSPPPRRPELAIGADLGEPTNARPRPRRGARRRPADLGGLVAAALYDLGELVAFRAGLDVVPREALTPRRAARERAARDLGRGDRRRPRRGARRGVANFCHAAPDPAGSGRTWRDGGAS